MNSQNMLARNGHTIMCACNKWQNIDELLLIRHNWIQQEHVPSTARWGVYMFGCPLQSHCAHRWMKFCQTVHWSWQWLSCLIMSDDSECSLNRFWCQVHRPHMGGLPCEGRVSLVTCHMRGFSQWQLVGSETRTLMPLPTVWHSEKVCSPCKCYQRKGKYQHAHHHEKQGKTLTEC